MVKGTLAAIRQRNKEKQHKDFEKQQHRILKAAMGRGKPKGKAFGTCESYRSTSEGATAAFVSSSCVISSLICCFGSLMLAAMLIEVRSRGGRGGNQIKGGLSLNNLANSPTRPQRVKYYDLKLTQGRNWRMIVATDVDASEDSHARRQDAEEDWRTGNAKIPAR